MGAIVSEVTAKIRNLVPESSGRWSDAALAALIHQAEMMVGEQCDSDWTTTEISLVAGALYYPLPVSMIGVGSVVLGVNGTDFIDDVLFPCTIADLDAADVDWRDTGGTYPTHYCLMGAPGSESSRILLWPKMETVTAEKVQITHLFSYTAVNLSLVARSMPAEVQDSVYVPLVMGMMYATIDQQRANLYFRSAFEAMPSVRSRFVSPYSGGTPGYTDPTTSRVGGQLR
ncbi:MAG: hypothetical protein WC120_05380 [Parcubacteria group bacterium]|jgi:hypothetical protein